MWSLKFIVSLFIFYFLDEISAQEKSEEESPIVKLIEILQDMVDMHENMSEYSSIAVGKWLKKPLIELTNRCESENILEAKLASYDNALFKIVNLLHTPKKNLRSVDSYPMVHDLWKNMFQVVFFGVQNCLEYDDVFLDEKEKLHVMATLFSEIVSRISYLNQLTLEDNKCKEKMAEEWWACQQPFELREEPLFHVLLGALKPSLGTCEENLSIKKCELDVAKKCSKNMNTIYKLILSPPGAIPCKNLEKW